MLQRDWYCCLSVWGLAVVRKTTLRVLRVPWSEGFRTGDFQRFRCGMSSSAVKISRPSVTFTTYRHEREGYRHGAIRSCEFPGPFYFRFTPPSHTG
jgi:hypothetical protein